MLEAAKFAATEGGNNSGESQNPGGNGEGGDTEGGGSGTNPGGGSNY